MLNLTKPPTLHVTLPGFRFDRTLEQVYNAKYLNPKTFAVKLIPDQSQVHHHVLVRLNELLQFSHWANKGWELRHASRVRQCFVPPCAQAEVIILRNTAIEVCRPVPGREAVL